LSNFTLLAPGFCGITSLHDDFDYGVAYINGAEGGLYNSVVAGNPTGLFLRDDETLDNADVNYTLNYSYNTGFENQDDVTHSGMWPAYCALVSDDWITGSAGGSCDQLENQFVETATPYDLGYSRTICNSSSPVFEFVSTTSIPNAEFDEFDDLTHP